MKIGFIGLGNVGGKLSGSLLRNGVDLVVHDLNEEFVQKFVDKGDTAGGSAAAMVRWGARFARARLLGLV